MAIELVHFTPQPDHTWTPKALRLVREEILGLRPGVDDDEPPTELTLDFDYYARAEGRDLIAVGALCKLPSNLMKLIYLAVDPARRGGGHGGRLLHDLEGVAREMGASALGTLPVSPDAQAFFEHKGYGIIPEIDSEDLYKQLLKKCRDSV